MESLQPIRSASSLESNHMAAQKASAHLGSSFCSIVSPYHIPNPPRAGPRPSHCGYHPMGRFDAHLNYLWGRNKRISSSWHNLGPSTQIQTTHYQIFICNIYRTMARRPTDYSSIYGLCDVATISSRWHDSRQTTQVSCWGHPVFFSIYGGSH